MNDMQFRFSLTNSTLGSQVIAEPIGWDDALLKLERDKEFFGVVEFYDQPITFYDQTFNGKDGGYDYVKTVKTTQGADATLIFKAEISEDEGNTFETIFEGLIDLSLYLEIDFYKIECGIIRNNLWSKFISRRRVSVDLKSSTDLDGDSRVVLNEKTLNLPSQKIRQLYSGYFPTPASFYAASLSTKFLQIDPYSTTLNEVEIKNNYANSIVSTPLGLFSIKHGGSYSIDVRLEMSRWARVDTTPVGYGLGDMQKTAGNYYVIVKLLVNDTVIVSDASKTNYAPNSSKKSTVYTLSQTITLNEGDELKIFAQGQYDLVESAGTPPTTYESIVIWGEENSAADIFHWNGSEVFDLDAWSADDGVPSGSANPSYIDITADTIYPDTTAPVFLIHEAFQSVLDRITGGDDTFYSEYLGRTNTQRITYGANGCGSSYALCKGTHIRGYELSKKIFSASFDHLWDIANPIFNLGLQYRNVSGSEVIEILTKDDLFEGGVSIYLDYVNNIEDSIDTEYSFKNIKIGYEKWEAEDYSGIDDPQTKREYATPLQKIGEEITLYSKAIAASIAIETTRRQAIEKGVDYKLDNDTFIFSLDTSDLGSNIYTADTDDEFSSISNLLNSTTRYNLKLTPSRNFLRWYRFFNGAFYDLYSSSSYKFTGGEGNYDLTSTQTGSCPGSGATDEGGNITMGTSAGLFRHGRYEFEHPLTWAQYKTIRDNKNKKIMVSSSNTGHTGWYIDSIQYQITKGLAKFKLMQS